MRWPASSGIAYCVTPTALALLGVASGSFAVSLGNTLYYDYGWYFRAAAIVLAVARTVKTCATAARAAGVAPGHSAISF